MEARLDSQTCPSLIPSTLFILDSTTISWVHSEILVFRFECKEKMGTSFT